MEKYFYIKIDSDKLRSIIRKARKSHSMSQICLSNVLAISQKSYSVLENGNGVLSLVQFLKLMHTLQLEPMEVIEEIVVTKPSWKTLKILRSEFENQLNSLQTVITELKLENSVLREQNTLLINKLCEFGNKD